MLKENINVTISKENINKTYSKLNNFFKEAINVVYGQPNDSLRSFDFNVTEIIDQDCRKSKYKKTDYCMLKDKTGVYIFLLKGVPVYIGVGGSGEKDDLKDRINAETHTYPTWNNATLSKNIQKIESIMSNQITSEETSMKYIKKYDLKGLVVGDNNKLNRMSSLDLEKLLTTIFKPKYNI